MNTFLITRNEEDRLQTLKSYGLLDTAEEEELNELTRLAAHTCNTPIALISLIDDKRQWFKSKVGVSVSQTNRCISFCQYTITDDTIFEVPNALEDERFITNPLVVGEPYIRFYTGVPLVNPEGFRLGSLCVIDVIPRQLTENQQQALKILAKQVCKQFELNRNQKWLREEKLKLELSQKKYGDLIGNNQGFIWTHDPEGRIMSINPAAVRALVYNEKEMVGKYVTDFLTPDSAQSFQDYLLSIRKKSVVQGTWQILTKYKEIRSWSYSNFRFDEGCSFYIIGSAHDITERETARELLLKAKQELETRVEERTHALLLSNQDLQAANNELDTFIYRASHDLRGPLASLLGICNLTKMESFDPAVQNYFEMIKKTATRMNHAITGLIDVSSIKNPVLNKEVINLQELIGRVLQEQKYIDGFEDFHFLIDIEADLLFRSDPLLIQSIFQNLITNAIRYRNQNNPSNPYIKISVHRALNTGICIIFQDNGSGIPESMQKKVFEMFYRGDVRSNGSGLGLYLVEKAIHKLGGHFKLLSEIYNGTTFEVFLPACTQKVL